jgi:hypothetical protein
MRVYPMGCFSLWSPSQQEIEEPEQECIKPVHTYAEVLQSLQQGHLFQHCQMVPF